jgi:hypothetical protein
MAASLAQDLGEVTGDLRALRACRRARFAVCFRG